MKSASIAILCMVLVGCEYSEPQRARVESEQTGACYVQKKTAEPIVSDGLPICKAVLDNFNHYCSEPPQLDHRKIHDSSIELSQPMWKHVNGPELLIKEIWTLGVGDLGRDTEWRMMKDRVLENIRRGTWQLYRADIGTGSVDERQTPLRGALQTVYKLELSGQINPPGGNQPKLLYVDTAAGPPDEAGIASPLFESARYRNYGDLWKFRNQWILVSYDPIDKEFNVKRLVRPFPEAGSTVAFAQECAIESLTNRKGPYTP
jgi:hypothetical protein